MEKRWKIIEADGEKLKGFIAETNSKIPTPLLKILIQRSVDNIEKAKAFFNPDLNSVHDPFAMKDMEAAVERLLLAIENQQKILVYGDYDVDGTTSVAMMVSFLRHIYKKELIEFYIPHRYKEGYGLSAAGVEYAANNSFDLVITLDCGIKSVDKIKYGNSLGLDFIVCDHHLPDVELPPAVAILNPKQNDCNYPYKELCGCGVGYKFITAICRRLRLPENFEHRYLDLVATAIAADIVPMTGENRVLAYHGLITANASPNPGILALKRLSQLEGDLHIHNLVFMIAPRVNAAGRMDDAKKAVLMFLADNEAEAMEYARALHTDNSERKETDQTITKEALEMIRLEEELKKKKSTVLFKETWHKGVVGIVASRLIEHYYRPTIVLTRSGEFASGSARSVMGFNVYEAIHECRDLLLNYGGHFYAAGLTLPMENVSLFIEKFEQVVESSIPPEYLQPVIEVDAEISFEEITQFFYNYLKKMEPYGPGNLRPVFLTRKVTDAGSRIVKDLHIKFCLKKDNYKIEGIGFNLAEKFNLLKSGKDLDVLFTISENEWNGNKSLQIRVEDLRSGE